jgi:polysaccharide export outer membrane protein
MKRAIWLAAVGILALTLGLAPAVAQQSGDAQSGEARGNGPAVRPAPGSTDPNYVIGAQDVVDISVWKEPEVSRTVPVRPDGMISLPLLGDVLAAGRSPMQLSREITEKLKRFIADPQVTVIITQINSQRIYIMGEVGRPGAYALLPGMTVLQALSNAGGFSVFAKLKDIYVLRTEGDKQVKHPFNYKDVIKGNRPEQNLELKAGDTVVVP